jgi:hypothetical protein
MRSVLALFAVTMALAPSPAAQEPTKTAAFALAVGPAWTYNLTGLHFRAEHHLIRDRWFGFRIEAGSFWTPTQSFSEPSFLYGTGSRFAGRAQVVDFSLGVAATVNPWPRGALAPYLVTGLAARQSWRNSWGVYLTPTGWPEVSVPPRSSTHGDIVGIIGLGIRARFGDRPVLFELRHSDQRKYIGLGTALRF